MLEAADPGTAPFEFIIRTPTGDRVELVCYAFTANSDINKAVGRPTSTAFRTKKYGSDFDRYHNIFIDPEGHKVTRSCSACISTGRLFIAVDPRMHTPTWFSRTVREFKTPDLNRPRRRNWHGWQRDRSDARRKQLRPENLQTETVISSDRTSSCVTSSSSAWPAVSIVARGCFLSDRIEESCRRRILLPAPGRHPLELQLGLPATIFSTSSLEHSGWQRRCNAAVSQSTTCISICGRYPDCGTSATSSKMASQISKLVQTKTLLDECKNVLARPQKGLPVDFRRRARQRPIPAAVTTNRRSSKVLAACLHPITKRWEFRFTQTKTLEPHRTCVGRLASGVVKNDWPGNLRRKILNQLYAS